MSSVQQLESILQAMLALKPPGVAKSKIEAITNLCVASFQEESSLVQTIYSHYKKTPNTHKLGVLYVVDSVTRQWIERARQAGQSLDQPKNATDGTYAAGVRRMNGLLPIFLNDLFLDLPEGQKDKAAKLLDIWERSNTFPQQDFTPFKQKLGIPIQAPNVPPTQAPVPISVPLSTPSNGNIAQSSMQGAIPQPQSLPIIATPNAVPNFGIAGNNTGAQYSTPGFQHQVAAPVSQLSQLLPAFQTMPVATSQIAPQVVAPVIPAAPIVPPAPAPAAAQGGFNLLAALGQIKLDTSNPATLALQIQLVQALTTGKIPAEQIPQVLAALGITVPNQQAAPLANLQQNTQVAQQPVMPQNGNQYDTYGLQVQQLDRVGGQPGSGSESNRQKHRQRSRSPDQNKRRRVSPPNRRKSPVYGTYDAAIIGPEGNQQQQQDQGRGKKGKGVKSQEPQGRNRPGSPQGLPKLIGFDPTLSANHIRVLSRTLFVGGVTGSEKEIEDIFSRFGNVQSVNVQHDKRHAFVKMYTRDEAERARKGMDEISDPNVLRLARQTRWGVGFGPRSCSDYETGESVIPIGVLTEADRRWVLEAKYGGTGGRPLETGMVIEEPDIEIGAGVSSKALGKRMEPQGKRGGHHQNGGGGGGGRGKFDPSASRFRKAERGGGGGGGQDHGGRAENMKRNEPRTAEEKAIGVPPPVPGFGFQLPGFQLPY